MLKWVKTAPFGEPVVPWKQNGSIGIFPGTAILPGSERAPYWSKLYIWGVVWSKHSKNAFHNFPGVSRIFTLEDFKRNHSAVENTKIQWMIRV